LRADPAAANNPRLSLRFDAMHPCLSCGACCASYRVAFHWMETDETTPEGVPAELSEPLDAHRLVMRGTRDAPVRCVALDAAIGTRSRCTIHTRRPSVCRALEASWESGRESPQCDRARAAFGLSALTPADWRWRDAPANDAPPDDSDHSPDSPSQPPVAA